MHTKLLKKWKLKGLQLGLRRDFCAWNVLQSCKVESPFLTPAHPKAEQTDFSLPISQLSTEDWKEAPSASPPFPYVVDGKKLHVLQLYVLVWSFYLLSKCGVLTAFTWCHPANIRILHLKSHFPFFFPRKHDYRYLSRSLAYLLEETQRDASPRAQAALLQGHAAQPISDTWHHQDRHAWTNTPTETTLYKNKKKRL